MKEIKEINKNITDVTKFVTGGKEDAKSVAEDKKEDIEEEDMTTPPTPPAPPSTPPATPPGGPTPPAGPPAPTPAPPIDGGHSKQSSRVRGIENKLKDEVDFTVPSAWLRSGGIPATRKDVVSTTK